MADTARREPEDLNVELALFEQCLKGMTRDDVYEMLIDQLTWRQARLILRLMANGPALYRDLKGFVVNSTDTTEAQA